MREILDWCLANWKLLVYIVCTLIILLCTLLKKPKVMDTIKEVILENLPSLINSVEEPGNGPTKLKAVVEMCVALINKLFPGVNANQYRSFIVKSVNAILKTPQSKG